MHARSVPVVLVRKNCVLGVGDLAGCPSILWCVLLSSAFVLQEEACVNAPPPRGSRGVDRVGGGILNTYAVREETKQLMLFNLIFKGLGEVLTSYAVGTTMATAQSDITPHLRRGGCSVLPVHSCAAVRADFIEIPRGVEEGL
ncbi:unnamed protein product [Ectocarpus sp. 12 AP-2014]